MKIFKLKVWLGRKMWIKYEWWSSECVWMKKTHTGEECN